MIGLHAAGNNELIRLLQRKRLAVAVEGPCIRLRSIDTDEVERLFPATIGCAGFNTKLGQVLGQVFARSNVTTASRAATLVFVVGELGDNVAHVIAADLRRRCLRCRMPTAQFHGDRR